jgi:GNAT superfamily N-acetyltransferase
LTPILKKYRDSPEARQKLFAFYRTVYPTMPEMVAEDRFNWQSFGNPLEDINERPLIWYLESPDGEVVGHNSIFLYLLSIGGREYKGYCSTNLVVKPGMEGRGIGHALIENNENLDGVPFAYGPTPASLSAFRKRGWVALRHARLQTIILHPVRALKFLKKPTWIAWLLAPALKILSVFLKIYRTVSAPRLLKGISFREIDRFRPEWDARWKEYLKDYAIHYIRRADFLNYKYCRRTDVKHNVLIFEKNDRPVGYIVFRTSASNIKNIRLGRVVDFVHDPDLGESLASYMIKAAVDRLIEDDVDSIVGVASSPGIKRAFTRNGMLLSRVQIMLVKETDFDVRELRPKYEQIWHLTLSDADMDNYW